MAVGCGKWCRHIKWDLRQGLVFKVNAMLSAVRGRSQSPKGTEAFEGKQRNVAGWREKRQPGKFRAGHLLMLLLVVQSPHSRARELRAVLEPFMETEVKDVLCQKSWGVGKTKIAGVSKNSFIFWASFVILLGVKYLTSAVPVACSLQMLAAGRVHSQEQSFPKQILKITRFAYVNNNYLYEQRFEDQTFIIILVLKDKSACSSEVLLIPTISNMLREHTASNPPKHKGIQEKHHSMSFWEMQWLLSS